MKTLIPASKIVKSLLGKAESADTYRLMTCVISEETEEGVLLYHTLRRELLLLSPEEYEHLFELPELYEKWFIVPEETEDRKLADQVRFVLRTLEPREDYINSYTIFTTTECNARCFYCYEKNDRRLTMSEATARQLVDFIEKHRGGKTVRLGWFGGEPLYNLPVIDFITGELTKRNIPFSSTMISNGYLLDGETARRAREQWKLQSVQITLDGTESVYNRTKAYIYKDGNPFERVLANIAGCLENGIRVTVRMNVSAANGDDLAELAELLHARFGENGYLSAYSHLLFQIEHNTDEETAQANEKKQRLDGLLTRYKMRRGFGFAPQPKLYSCAADSDHSVTVLPDGKLGACEHYLDSYYIGSIWTDTVDEEARQVFREYVSLPECDVCPLYPECRILTKCEPSANCDSLHRESTLRELKNSMKGYCHLRLKDANIEKNEKGDQNHG